MIRCEEKKPLSMFCSRRFCSNNMQCISSWSVTKQIHKRKRDLLIDNSVSMEPLYFNLHFSFKFSTASSAKASRAIMCALLLCGWILSGLGRPRRAQKQTSPHSQAVNHAAAAEVLHASCFMHIPQLALGLPTKIFFLVHFSED